MKISFIIIIYISSILILGCTASTTGSSEEGYLSLPFLGGNVTDLDSTKQFGFSNISESCTGILCNSIIYEGNGYVGIAVDDSHDSGAFSAY